MEDGCFPSKINTLNPSCEIKECFSLCTSMQMLLYCVTQMYMYIIKDEVFIKFSFTLMSVSCQLMYITFQR